MSLFPGESYDSTVRGVRVEKTAFRGQVCAHVWAWVHLGVRFSVTKPQECLVLGDLGNGFCYVCLKGTNLSPKGKFLF